MILCFSIPYQLLGFLDPVNGVEIAFPVVEIRGKLIQHTFPGIPNYESIEDGDMPETRVVLEVLPAEIDQLRREGYIPEEGMYEEETGWIQLDSDVSLSCFLNRHVTVAGILGSRIVHVHTPVTIEVIDLWAN